MDSTKCRIKNVAGCSSKVEQGVLGEKTCVGIEKLYYTLQKFSTWKTKYSEEAQEKAEKKWCR